MGVLLQDDFTPKEEGGFEVVTSTQPEELKGEESQKDSKPDNQVDLEKETIKNSILINNPFLYVKEYRIYNINSIEDYYIKQRKETIPFGDIVRSVEDRRGKKIRKVKKIFEFWKNDYLVVMQKSMNDDIRRLGARPQIDIIGAASILFLLLFAIIYFGLIFVVFQKFLTLPTFFMEIKSLFLSSLHNMLFFGVFIALGVLILLAGFLGIKYNKVARGYKRLFDKNDKALNNSRTKILSDFEKKYNNAYRYYMKNLKKNNFFLPLNVEEIDCGAGIDSFNNMVDKTSSMKEKYEKSHALLVLYKYPVYIFMVIAFLFVIGYLGYTYFVK